MQIYLNIMTSSHIDARCAYVWLGKVSRTKILQKILQNLCSANLTELLFFMIMLS